MDLSTPLVWPAAWDSPRQLELLDRAAIGTLLVDGGGPSWLREAAAQRGFSLLSRDQLGSDKTRIVKGEWPGIRLSQSGGDTVAAGPTGALWLTSNGWRAQVEWAAQPQSRRIWVAVPPPPGNAVLPRDAYSLAIADTAAGLPWRMILELSEPLAKAIAAGNADAAAIWQAGSQSARYFNNLRAAPGELMGNIGVVSDFEGPNADFTGELVNLISRAGGQVMALSKYPPFPELRSLRTIVYADQTAPAPELKARILERVKAGGASLLTTPDFGPLAKHAAIQQTASRPEDPYEFAAAAVTMTSHRHDLVRVWNGGTHSARCTASADGKTVTTHHLFYLPDPVTEATVWLAGTGIQGAKLRTIEKPEPRALGLRHVAGGVEVRLPALRTFAEIEWAMRS